MRKMKNAAIGTMIGRAYRILKYNIQKEFLNAGYNLTLEQWVLLHILKMKDGISQHDISQIIFKEKTTITRLIDGVEKKKLIVRVRDDKDRRNNLIYLTDDGKIAESVLTPIAERINKKALNGFTKEETEMSFALMNKMINNFND